MKWCPNDRKWVIPTWATGACRISEYLRRLAPFRPCPTTQPYVGTVGILGDQRVFQT